MFTQVTTRTQVQQIENVTSASLHGYPSDHKYYGLFIETLIKLIGNVGKEMTDNKLTALALFPVEMPRLENTAGREPISELKNWLTNDETKSESFQTSLDVNGASVGLCDAIAAAEVRHIIVKTTGGNTYVCIPTVTYEGCGVMLLGRFYKVKSKGSTIV